MPDPSPPAGSAGEDRRAEAGRARGAEARFLEGQAEFPEEDQLQHAG